MSKRIKVMSVFGTRPEAIKMAPLVLELQKHPELESVVCITAQHREMLDSVMDCFGIRADYDLNIMQQGQDLTAITTRVLLPPGGIGVEYAFHAVCVAYRLQFSAHRRYFDGQHIVFKSYYSHIVPPQIARTSGMYTTILRPSRDVVNHAVSGYVTKIV